MRKTDNLPFISLHENLEEKLPGFSKYFVVLHEKGKDGIMVFVLGKNCHLSER